MSHIVGRVKRFENSEWTTTIKLAGIFIDMGRVFPELRVWDTNLKGSKMVIHLYSMINLTDCGSTEGYGRIFLTFKDKLDGEDIYETVEFNKLLGKDGREMSTERKAQLFKRILDRASIIKGDLDKPYVTTIPALYGLPRLYDFSTEFSAFCAFSKGEDGTYRIGECGTLALVSGSELEKKGMNFDAKSISSKYFTYNWLIVDAGESGASAIPILPTLSYEISADSRQVSIAFPSALPKANSSKEIYIPITFAFLEDSDFQGFADKFSEYFTFALRRSAGYKVDDAAAREDNSFVSRVFYPHTFNSDKTQNVMTIELSSSSSDVEELSDGYASKQKPSMKGSARETMEVNDDDGELQYLDPRILRYDNPKDGKTSMNNQMIAQFLFQESAAAVSRGDALELCQVQPKLRTTSLNLKDDTGNILTPGSLRFSTNTDGLLSTAIGCSDENKDIIYKTDLNRPDVMQFYKATDKTIDYHPEIVDFDVGKAGATSVGACSIRPDNAILALTKMGMHMLDTRIAGDSQRMGVSFQYKSDVRFTSVLVTPKGHVVTGSITGEIRIFTKVGQRASVIYPGVGYPITHLAITKDEKWILATAHSILLVYSTVTTDGESSCFSGRGISADKKSKPLVLRLSPDTMFEIGISSNSELRPATFSLDETEIFSGTNKYILVWDFEKVKAGIVSSSKACTKIALPDQLIGAGMGIPGHLTVGTHKEVQVIRHGVRKSRKK